MIPNKHLKKEDIVEELLGDEYWEDLYVEYVRKGLMREKKKKLLEMYNEMKGDEE